MTCWVSRKPEGNTVELIFVNLISMAVFLLRVVLAARVKDRLVLRATRPLRLSKPAIAPHL